MGCPCNVFLCFFFSFLFFSFPTITASIAWFGVYAVSSAPIHFFFVLSFLSLLAIAVRQHRGSGIRYLSNIYIYYNRATPVGHTESAIVWGGQEKNIGTKTPEKKEVGFSSASLFPARKWEVSPRVEPDG